MDAVIYLLNVITKWDTFCKSHPHLKEAIVTVLCENQMLKLENERLKEQIQNEK